MHAKAIEEKKSNFGSSIQIHTIYFVWMQLLHIPNMKTFAYTIDNNKIAKTFTANRSGNEELKCKELRSEIQRPGGPLAQPVKRSQPVKKKTRIIYLFSIGTHPKIPFS